MKKTIFAVFRMLVLGALMMPVVSCEKEIRTDNEQEEIQDDPSKNTTDIAVTGSVEKCGFSYVVINGYVNLSLLPSGNDNPSFGVEVKEEGRNEGEQEYSTVLTGNKFSVLCRNLSATQEYSYRTFVKYGGITHYGEYCKFTTKDFVNITATGEATEITVNSADISLEELPNSFDKEESWTIGLAYSVRESTLQPDSIHSDDCDFVFTPEGAPRHLCNLKPNTTYHYAAFTYVDGKSKFAQIKSFTTLDHRQAIDLGLSVKWASCNVGASSPDGYGGYYAWGETEEKSYYDFANYKYYNSSTGNHDYIGTNISGTSYDVAHVKWGGSWRMPTLKEIQELINNCSWKWTTVNGVEGQKVTGPNGNSIFLPAAGLYNSSGWQGRRVVGNYWSGTFDEKNESRGERVYNLDFESDYSECGYHVGRGSGCTVRPVTE